MVPGPSGISRRVTEYLEGVSEKYQVVVLSTKTPDHSHIERYRGARLLRVPVGTGDLQSRIQTFDRAVRRQLESEEYLLVHCFDPFAGYALCERRDELSYRIVYDAQTFPSQELRYSHPHLEGDRRFLSKVRRQELFCLMNSDAVITGSETTRAFIVDQGVPGTQVRVFRTPVDRTPYTPETMGRPDASPMKILHLGSQLGYQGLPTLLKAMQLAIQNADVRLTVVGPKHNEWQAHLMDQVTELKLSGKVEFQAPVNGADVHKIVATCDVGAVCLDDNERNRRQGGPLARLGDYLAGGRPVLAADLPVTRELLTEEHAMFYAPGDPRALAEKIVALAQDPKRRVRMGAAARHLSEKYDAAFVRGQLLDLYAELAGKPRGDPGEEAAAEITRTAGRPTRDDSSKSNRHKTDPAIRAGDQRESSETTDPEARAAENAILGTPVRDDRPVVAGVSLPKLDDPHRAAITDRANPEQPVLMGTPLADRSPDPTPQELPALELIRPNKDLPKKDDKKKVRHTPPSGLPPAKTVPRHTPPHGIKAATAEKPTRHTPAQGVKAAVPEKPAPRHTPAHGVPAAGALGALGEPGLKQPTAGKGLAAPKVTPPRGTKGAEPKPSDKSSPRLNVVTPASARAAPQSGSKPVAPKIEPPVLEPVPALSPPPPVPTIDPAGRNRPPPIAAARGPVPAIPGLTEDFEPRTPQVPPPVMPVTDPAAHTAKTADFEANTPQEPLIAHKPEVTGDFAPHLPKTEALELPEEPAEVGDEEVMEVGSGELPDPPKKPSDDSVPFATPESLELADSQ
ncbi:MAG: glycosyltransferase [Myxococcaceae bacterium]